MKKIIAAPDSFKGSLTAAEVAESIRAGVLGVFPDCEVVLMPIADGGEGTVDALVSALRGEYVACTVSDPLMRPVEARYGLIDGGRTAVIETAAASGLTLLEPDERDPMRTTTYGTGELVRDALLRGCRRIIIGAGGSATNDAGTGLMQALGFRFRDAAGDECGLGGGTLARIASIDASGAMPQLREAEITVAYDVDSRFCGPQGAAHVFAPQKGADAAMTEELDAGLRNFAGVLMRHTGVDVVAMPGAGAAGGLGGGLATLLRAKLAPGIEMVLKTARFGEALADADLVITGEGRLDRQTLAGKAPYGVLKSASAHNVPVIAIGGAVEDAGALENAGFAGIHIINEPGVEPERAMERSYAAGRVESTVGRIMRRIKEGGMP